MAKNVANVLVGVALIEVKYPIGGSYVELGYTEDGCQISGGEKLHGADIDTQGDHRILMAAALAGLVSTSGTTIEDDSSYKVSYPGFLRDMHQLGCRLEVRR